ncbi:MAG: fasciclin domain-containing protein, partial [Aggregatilineales bacterium]
MKKLLSILLLTVLLVSGIAQAQDQNIVEIAAGNEDFSTLVTAVQAAGLVDVLADPNAEWTVFAPTNAAFEAVPAEVMDMVLADTELLTRILTYHVVEGTVTSDMLSDMMAPTMEMTAVGADLLGGQLDVQVADDGSVTVNGANVVTADILASNGVIHVIDAVLLPPDVAEMVGDMMGDMDMDEDMDMSDDDMMMDDDMGMDTTIFATLNPGDLAGDAIVGLSFGLGETRTTFDAFEGIASIQSVKFTQDGTAYATVDVDENGGGILVIDGLGNADSMAVGAGSRLIAGSSNVGLNSPKGLEVIEDLNLVLVANFGSNNIKGFPLDASGDSSATAFISNFGGATGSIWDVHYDGETDTLFATGTTGILFTYTNFSTDLGVSGPAAQIIPSDADGNQISVNLHGVEYVASSDTLLLSDVGAAGDATDGQIFVISGASMADGNTPVDTALSGGNLGNPVDIFWDAGSLFVAEKANDVIERYDGLVDMMGMMDAAPAVSMAFTKPESVAYVPMMGMMMDDEMMDDDMMMMPEGNIVEIAVGNPDFSTLVTAVQAAGLVDVLADPNAEWTVFAPTNAAFEALPEGVLDMVLADNELLTRILTYHVVEGTVTSDMLSDMMAPTMEMTAVGADLLGGQLDVQVADDGSVTVNGVNVVAADIMATNGVIHVVDQVLLPPDVAEMVGDMMGDMDEDMGDMEEMGTIVDIAVGNPDFSTLVTAVQAAGLVDVLADPNAEWTVFAPTNAAFEALPE